MDPQQFLENKGVAVSSVDTFSPRNGWGKLDLASLLEEYSKGKKEHKHIPFKRSNRAAQLAEKLREQFGIEFRPEIRRRFTDCEVVKFEMRDLSGQVYYFKGIVVDFLRQKALIEKIGTSFSWFMEKEDGDLDARHKYANVPIRVLAQKNRHAAMQSFSNEQGFDNVSQAIAKMSHTHFMKEFQDWLNKEETN